jgi:hypothetical protein
MGSGDFVAPKCFEDPYIFIRYVTDIGCIICIETDVEVKLAIRIWLFDFVLKRE